MPDNVRRYYLPSSTHGGGDGGFNEARRRMSRVNCPGNNWGRGALQREPGAGDRSSSTACASRCASG